MLSFSILSLCALLASTAHAIPTNATQHHDSVSYVQAAYFPNWGIYGENFQPTDIDPSRLTHILYAFADVSPTTGQIVLTDSWADEQKHFPGDSWDDSGNNLYGCLKQLYLLKLAHRHLKLLLSVGGWTYSQAGHFSFLTNGQLRRNFVTSAVELIKDYGLDGIDIDFEYPADASQGQGLLDLLTSLRGAFDELAHANGDATHYELTAAVAAGPENYAHYLVAQMDRVLDYWNLMAYDYAGSWLSFADNQANLYGGSRTGVSTDVAIKHYLSSGATASKITMGIPLYGRAFENTNGIGQSYDGVGQGTSGAGIYAYKDLPLSGAHVVEDLVDVASYSYDPVKRELVSYDDPEIVRIKAEYVRSRSLAGCMFWDLSTDKTGSTSLVRTAGTALSRLDQTPNHVHYPHSKWDNIRENMGLNVNVPTMTTSSTTVMMSMSMTSAMATRTAMPSSTPSSPPNACVCDDVVAWQATEAYTGGKEVLYGGHLWTAKWWTENDVPGGAADVWKNEGACA